MSSLRSVAAVPLQASPHLYERLLLVLAAVFVGITHVQLILAQPDRARGGIGFFVWLTATALLHILLDRTSPRRDPYLLPVVMLLSGWGLALVARLAPAFLTRQLIWLTASCGVTFLVTLLPPGMRWLRRYRYTWLLGGLVLLGATLIIGVNPSGEPGAPRLWLNLGILYLQPSEILKLLLIVFLASYLAEKHNLLTSTSRRLLSWSAPSLPYLAPMLLMWGFCIVLLAWQRDLGAASLFFIIFLVMLYVATQQAWYLVAGAILLVIAGALGYYLYGVVRLRIDTWWNPWPEANDRAFQIVQSLIAVATGGIIGTGIGQGVPTFIPVVHSDFAYAAIAEEWGLAGSVAVVACFALLVSRAFHIAETNTSHPFRVFLATGIGVGFGAQSLLIMAGILKLIPLTGVTLPFVSYGGSSLLSSFIMLALLLKMSSASKMEEAAR